MSIKVFINCSLSPLVKVQRFFYISAIMDIRKTYFFKRAREKGITRIHFCIHIWYDCNYFFFTLIFLSHFSFYFGLVVSRFASRLHLNISKAICKYRIGRVPILLSICDLLLFICIAKCAAIRRRHRSV